MVKSSVFVFIFTAIIFSACSKSQHDTIDVSEQKYIDYNGNATGGSLNDGQWEPKVFTSQEQDLFKVLDTASLTGTMMPDTVQMTSMIFFPNPFSSVASLYFTFTPGYNGQVELKYVIVDSHLNIQESGAFRIQATSDPNFPSGPSVSNFIHLSPNVAPGQYRIYFTLSTDLRRDFYSSWGNIQKSG